MYHGAFNGGALEDKRASAADPVCGLFRLFLYRLQMCFVYKAFVPVTSGSDELPLCGSRVMRLDIGLQPLTEQAFVSAFSVTVRCSAHGGGGYAQAIYLCRYGGHCAIMLRLVFMLQLLKTVYKGMRVTVLALLRLRATTPFFSKQQGWVAVREFCAHL